MIPLFSSIKQKNFPFFTYSLITGNIYVFLLQGQAAVAGTIESMISHYAVIPQLFISSPVSHWPSLITSQFFHGGWMHLLGNMLYLLIFGRNIEDSFGHMKFIFFYVFGGICGALLQIYFSPGSSIPMIGASGAISAVLGAYFLIHPTAKIHTLIPLGIFSRIIRFPAFLFLGVWFAIQAYSGAASHAISKSLEQDVGGVAWWAHTGGFIVGVIAAIIYRIKKAI